MANENTNQNQQDEPLGEPGLKALQEERKARKALERKLQSMQQIDPDEFQRLKDEAAEREQRDLEEKQQYEKLKEKQLETTHKALSERDEWKGKYIDSILEREAKKAFTGDEVGGFPDSFELFWSNPEVRKRVQYDGENTVVLDKAGVPMLRKDGTPATIADLAIEKRENGMGRLFAAINPTQGTGRSPNTGTPPRATAVRRVSATDTKTISDNLEAIAKGEVVVTMD